MRKLLKKSRVGVAGLEPATNGVLRPKRKINMNEGPYKTVALPTELHAQYLNK